MRLRAPEPQNKRMELMKRPRLATRARRGRPSAATGRFAAHPWCYADDLVSTSEWLR
jgi:hypothetical protein